MTTYTTNKNTAAEIIAEAKTITAEVRSPAEALRRQKILALRKQTGLEYAVSVTKGMYQLEIIDFSGKKVVVNKVGEAMPFFQFNEFVKGYEHA